MKRFWRWLFPHEHVYCLSFDAQNFRCRCGETIEGEDLFDADTILGRYWRDRQVPK